MATRSPTGDTPLPPFQAPAEAPMTLDEAIHALQPICQAWVGLQSLASVLSAIKIFQVQSDALKKDWETLVAKRQQTHDALAQDQSSAEMLRNKITEDLDGRRKWFEAEVSRAEATAKDRIAGSSDQAAQAQAAAVKVQKEFDALTADLRKEKIVLEQRVTQLRAELAALKARLG